jgi:hypothetical protein
VLLLPSTLEGLRDVPTQVLGRSSVPLSEGEDPLPSMGKMTCAPSPATSSARSMDGAVTRVWTVTVPWRFCTRMLIMERERPAEERCPVHEEASIR